MKYYELLLVFTKCRLYFYSNFTLIILLTALALGGTLRAVDVKEHFSVNGGFNHYVEMASHFWTQPGGYNFLAGVDIQKDPEGYVFTRNPSIQATGSFENEKGWMFYLSLIFLEGSKGLENLADRVIAFNIAWEMVVIICLFFCGKSIAGPLGGSLSSILYALFIPAMRQASWVSYYYWAIPLSAFSLLFWVVIYRPEKYSLKTKTILFFLYGLLTGFATFGRLGFLLLPIAMIPVIFIREKSFKNGTILSGVMLLAHLMLLMPQVMITKHWYSQSTLSTRGKWHHVISGLGAHPNPWSIKDTGDLTAVKWAIDQGGPDLNGPGVGIVPYDQFMKSKAITLLKDNPEIFWKNFKDNLYRGITLTPLGGARYMGGPKFAIFLNEGPGYSEKAYRLAALFPWMVLAGGIIIFFFQYRSFLLFFPIVLQGIYLLAVLTLYFPPADVHTTAYFPIFILLMGVSVSIIFKFFYSLMRTLWAPKPMHLFFPYMVREFHLSNFLGSSIGEQANSEYEEIEARKFWMWGFASILSIYLITDVTCKYLFNSQLQKTSGAQAIQEINTLLSPYDQENLGFSEKSAPSKLKGWNDRDLVSSEKPKLEFNLENIHLGRSSIKLQASGSLDSVIFFKITPDKLYSLLGKTILLECWVKSENKMDRKISMFIKNGIDSRRFPVTYYQKSGNWEKLSISYTVPPSEDTFALFLKVGKGSSEPAYFDSVNLRLMPTSGS